MVNPKKKPNEWNNISDYIFVFTDIQNCDGHWNGDCDGKTAPPHPCKPHTSFYEISLDELNNAHMTIIPFVRSSSATSYT